MKGEKSGLYYRTTGDGPPLLLLHGFTGDGSWWDPYVDVLAESYTTIVPDLPGHGRSEVGPDPWRFDQVAANVFALMDELGEDRFRAIGFSGGASVVTHMAIQMRDRIDSMALVADTDARDREVMLAFPNFEDHSARIREYWLGIHPGGEAQVRRLIASLHHLADHVDEMYLPPEMLSGIRARTLIVVGDRDPGLPVQFAVEAYHAIPDAALWIVPGHGHQAIFPDWGGSAEAASIFPDVVTRFLGIEPLGPQAVQ